MADVLSLTYSDIKTVKTRGVFQLVLEAPIEAMPAAFALLGAPVPGNEVWVAVARLRGKPEALEALASVTAIEPPVKPSAKLSQLAGILSNEGGFKQFVAEQTGMPTDTDAAADFIRLTCSVKSRADIDGNANAERAFRDLKSAYDIWLKDVA